MISMFDDVLLYYFTYIHTYVYTKWYKLNNNKNNKYIIYIEECVCVKPITTSNISALICPSAVDILVVLVFFFCSFWI